VIQKASFELLRIQALAARSGERLPPPGNIKANDPTRVLINPL
ncbi:integrase, partial [Salmonella enterica]|nr:integrase [Salmonella enterica]